jgi:hypothetical protein
VEPKEFDAHKVGKEQMYHGSSSIRIEFSALFSGGGRRVDCSSVSQTHITHNLLVVTLPHLEKTTKIAAATMRLSLSLCVAVTAAAFCQGFTTPTASTSTSTALNSALMQPWTMMPDEPQPEVCFGLGFPFHVSLRVFLRICCFSRTKAATKPERILDDPNEMRTNGGIESFEAFGDRYEKDCLQLLISARFPCYCRREKRSYRELQAKNSCHTKTLDLTMMYCSFLICDHSSMFPKKFSILWKQNKSLNVE